MTVAASPVLGRPLWFELMTSDSNAAEDFYKKVVGWSSAPFKESPQPYTMFQRSGEVPVAGVMTTPEGMNAPPFWAMYVGVPKIEEGVKAHRASRRQPVLAGDRRADGRPHADDEGSAGRGVLHLRAVVRAEDAGGAAAKSARPHGSS